MSDMPPNEPVPQTTPASLPPSSPAPTVPYASADPSLTPDPADVEKNKILAVLSYLGILVLVPILAAKDSRFARFHANQGLILLITAFAVSILLVPVVIGVAFIPFIGWCLSPVIGMVVSLGLIALVILGIVNAATGKMAPLPVIGQFKILK